MGTWKRGFVRSLFLRSFTTDVTLVAPNATHDLTSDQRDARAAPRDQVCWAMHRDPTDRIADCSDLVAERVAYENLSSALVSKIQSGLARQHDAKMSEDGFLTVEARQRTSITGLFAAGDVGLGCDKISHAFGEGGVAATTISNDLARRTPLC